MIALPDSGKILEATAARFRVRGDKQLKYNKEIDSSCNRLTGRFFLDML